MSRTIYQKISYFIILALFMLPIQAALGAVAMHLHNDLHYDESSASTTSFVHHKIDSHYDVSNDTHKIYTDLQADEHCDNQSDTCHSCSSCAHCISIVYISRFITKDIANNYLVLQPNSFQSINSMVKLRPPRFYFS